MTFIFDYNPFKFAIGLVTGQVKVLAWSRYDAEKQDNLVDTSKQFSSVGWNLVNWNVERTRICLSEFTPFFSLWTIMDLFSSQIFLIFAPKSKWFAVSAEKQEQLYIMNLKQNAYE